MRAVWLLPVLWMVSACDPFGGVRGPVDVTKLPPLSGQEIALITSAEAAASKGDAAQAERNYMEAVAKSQGRIEAHLGLANFYAKTNELQKAQDILERANALQPEQPRVAYLLGKMYLTENRISEALKIFNTSIAKYPADLELLTATAIAHDMIPEHAKAQALYLRAQALNPKEDLSVLRTNLAMSYILTGKSQQAVDLLKADAAKPNASPVTRHNLALAYGVLGRDKDAVALLKDELSEAERKANVQRIKDYIAQRKGIDAVRPKVTVKAK